MDFLLFHTYICGMEKERIKKLIWVLNGVLEEEWKDLDEFIKVSNKGNILSRKGNGKGCVFPYKSLNGWVNNDGYRKVWINKTESVHRLVGELFIPNDDNLPQINHLNGNKDCNNIYNLEWCNQSRNQQHAFRTGLQPRMIIDDKDVPIIKELYKSGKYNQREIAELYGVKQPHISDIINNKKRVDI